MLGDSLKKKQMLDYRRVFWIFLGITKIDD